MPDSESSRRAQTLRIAGRRPAGGVLCAIAVAAGIACAGVGWLLIRPRRQHGSSERPVAFAVRRAAVPQELEWVCLLAGIAPTGRGSPAHVLVPVLEGDRTGQHLLRLALLGLSFLLRGWRTGRPIRWTGIEGPVLLLLAGQALPHLLMREGRWYLPKAVRTAAALGTYYGLLEGGGRAQTAAATLVALNAASVAVHWPTTWDFSGFPAYYAPLQRIGLAINRRIPPLSGHRLQKNRAGSLLAAAIPIALALAGEHRTSPRVGSRALAALFGSVSLLASAGLLLTFSRASWLALGSAVLLLGSFRLRRSPWAVRALLVASAVPPTALAAGTLSSEPRLLSALRRLSRPTRSFDVRRDLARDGETLVCDYRYTGVGTGRMSLIHATYCLLHHVPALAHLHNTYVATWVENGLLGAAGLTSGTLTVLGWARRAHGRSDLAPLAAGGLASLAAVGVMGFAQDHFNHGVRSGGAGSSDFYTADWRQARTLLAPGVLLGVAGALARTGVPDEPPSGCARWLPLLAAPLLLPWAVRRRRALVAAWHANLGALFQTHYELRRYDPARFDRPLVDEIRRDEAALAPAEVRFRRALAWDPRNATALQRLGAIALSRGRYDEAGRLLRQAWATGHRDRVTRLLYGDVLVAEEREAEAVAILRGLELAASRLHFQAWYRYEARGDRTRAEHARRAAALLEADDWPGADPPASP